MSKISLYLSALSWVMACDATLVTPDASFDDAQVRDALVVDGTVEDAVIEDRSVADMTLEDLGVDAAAEDASPDATVDASDDAALDALLDATPDAIPDAMPPRASRNFISYIGGTSSQEIVGDMVRDVVVDGEGNVYATGGIDRYSGPLFENRIGNMGREDIFVIKLDPEGRLVYSTLVSGPGYDRAYAIEVDASGAAYVAGRAGNNFPTTAGVLQRNFAGDNDVNGAYGAQDGVIFKLNPAGTQLVWATYLGGPGRGFIRDMAIDSLGAVYAGVTYMANNFPHVTANSFRSSPPGGINAVIAKVSPDGSRLVYGGYLSAGGDDGRVPSIRVNAAGEAFVLSGTRSTGGPVTANAYQSSNAGGTDVLISRIAADGRSLIYSTYLGGSADEHIETHNLEINSRNEAIAVIGTSSSNMPTTNGTLQGTKAGGDDLYIARLSADGSQLLAGTYFGGNRLDFVEGVAVDPRSGEILITGGTQSTNFMTTSDAYQGSFRGGGTDGIVLVVSEDLTSVVYSSFLGGSGGDQARSAAYSPLGYWVGGGRTRSTDLPVLNALQANNRGGDSEGFFFHLRP